MKVIIPKDFPRQQSYGCKCPVFSLYGAGSPSLHNILCTFYIFLLTRYETYCIFISMAATFEPHRYFAHPRSPGQKQYEALRAFYVDNLPARVVADRFVSSHEQWTSLRLLSPGPPVRSKDGGFLRNAKMIQITLDKQWCQDEFATPTGSAPVPALPSKKTG